MANVTMNSDDHSKAVDQVVTDAADKEGDGGKELHPAIQPENMPIIDPNDPRAVTPGVADSPVDGGDVEDDANPKLFTPEEVTAQEKDLAKENESKE